MTIKLCHHHGFTVSDLDRSVAYYRDLLGLEVIRISERSNLPSYDQMLGFKDVKLRVGLLRHPVNAFLLELFQYLNPPSEKRALSNQYVGSSHIAYEVDDVDTVYQQLQASGYSAIHSPVDVIRDGRKVARGMYALDPDGISVEIFQEFADVIST
jgi:lactoylglutathione lyase